MRISDWSSDVCSSDLDGDGGMLTIRRVLKADGGSRAFVNDQPVSAGLLRDLGALLVEVHGQHDDRGLLNPRGHRSLIDAFGGLTAALGATAMRSEEHTSELQSLMRNSSGVLCW